MAESQSQSETDGYVNEVILAGGIIGVLASLFGIEEGAYMSAVAIGILYSETIDD